MKSDYVGELLAQYYHRWSVDQMPRGALVVRIVPEAPLGGRGRGTRRSTACDSIGARRCPNERSKRVSHFCAVCLDLPLNSPTENMGLSGLENDVFDNTGYNINDGHRMVTMIRMVNTKYQHGINMCMVYEF